MTPISYIAPRLFSEINTLLGHYAPTIHRWYMVSDAACATAYRLQDMPFQPAYFHCFDHPPKATYALAEELATCVRSYEGIIAVGSGTINDLAKYAAHSVGIPYIIIASAPSMNGYISANASLIHNGHKQSFAATPPLALFADTNVLRNAPHRLIASGIGDTLCRSTVEMDMMMADYSNYPSALFAEMRDKEIALLQALETSDGQVTDILIDTLMACLLYGGQAMNEAGSSAPASQSEHMLVHMLEVLAPQVAAQYFHGELVAAATIYASKMQEYCLGNELTTPLFPPFPTEEITHIFGAEHAAAWQHAYAEKVCLHSPAKEKNYDYGHHLLSSQQLTDYLRKAGCPTDIQALFAADIFTQALKYVRFSRNRLTIWDRCV